MERVSDVFRGYRKTEMKWNGLINFGNSISWGIPLILLISLAEVL